MTIAFFSNFINHHQVHISDLLWDATGGNYTFIETIPMHARAKHNGYPDYSDRPYVLQAWRNAETKQKSFDVVRNVDVALFDGSEALPYEIERYRSNEKLLSFEVDERWCKHGVINYASPRFLKWYWHYLTRFRNCNVFKLCCSAYLPNDMYQVGAFKEKCYKWAYFTKANPFDIHATIKSRNSERLQIMWCARFIGWKHPEMPIKLAYILKREGYSFDIDMYGGGVLFDKISTMVKDLHVEDVVHIKGNAPNDTILQVMRKHHIFLFTSDRNEGWGAVCNEAMSNGCAVIGDERIGAVPFLIKHGFNGRIYKTRDISSLKEQITYYIDNPDELEKNCIEAYKTMTERWSPKVAVENLMVLIDSFKKNNYNPIQEGPCSKTYPIK